MGNHEYCLDCGASDYHYGRDCDPETKRKHQNRHDPCSCRKSKLNGSRRCSECGGYQTLKESDVKGTLMRIEWERQLTARRVASLRAEIKQVEKNCETRIAALRAKCKHVLGGFAEAYVCEKCGLTEIN